MAASCANYLIGMAEYTKLTETNYLYLPLAKTPIILVFIFYLEKMSKIKILYI